MPKKSKRLIKQEMARRCWVMRRARLQQKKIQQKNSADTSTEDDVSTEEATNPSTLRSEVLHDGEQAASHGLQNTGSGQTADTSDNGIMIPAVLMPSYDRLISTEEGKNAMKRIRVECGACKGIRFYSIHRGIADIAGVIVCEACRLLYQRVKKQTKVEYCDKQGRCFMPDEMPKKCSACRMACILTRCPVPHHLYVSLLNCLPKCLRKKMRKQPVTAAELPEGSRGGLGLEVYKGDTWEDVTDKAEVQALMQQPAVEPNEDQDMEFEEMMVDEHGLSEALPTEDPLSSTLTHPSQPSHSSHPRRGRRHNKLNSDPDHKVMASLLEGLKVSNQFMEDFNPKTSERVRRKKKIQYFLNSGRGKYTNPSPFHGPDGKLLGTGKDLCDCLIGDCPGCHFPCLKCGSGKCGRECRVNRKWYYDKVEVEGSSLSWNNEYMKKL